MTVSINGTSGLVFNDASTQNTAATGFGFKNRIINGAMTISQAAAGSSITPAATGASSANFAVDRTRIAYSQNSKLTAQQNRGSVTPPAGFKNYVGVGVASTATVGATDYFLAGQTIEGYNTSDLAWGTASAATITLSFWVYSNTTGTFGGAVNNSAYDRSYVFSYTINVANTWEQKTVTIAGDTSGTWLTDNSAGIRIWFSLGTGSTLSKASGSWGAGEYYSATGATSLMGNTSNYLYITGVQLEKGSTATSFDYRPYTTELQLCQRYLPAWNTSATNGPFAIGQAVSTTIANIMLPYQVQPRVPPTGITASAAGSFYLVNSTNGLAGTYSSTTFSYASLNTLHLNCVTSGGLVGGNATYLGTNTAPAQILATGCEL
jgi:hypothetical protein